MNTVTIVDWGADYVQKIVSNTTLDAKTRSKYYTTMHIDVSTQRGLEFMVMGTCEQQQDKELLALSALYIHAMHCTFNGYRCSSPKGPAIIYQCIWQHMLQGCRGHAALERSLNSRWNKPFCIIR